ncbi:AAA family ATPase [Clostridium sp. C2-6-12]|uniref:AAA family ATPase n=1 Tax=Clostridium sp. C2-6-12 TaxID=2698832 RepID=UPI00136F16BC|nr:AAA family ATPase [Clostridium sp. C2-6-12]
MKNRLILIEGIPGSGKSTISKKIRDYLINKGLDVDLYNEGDLHPVDMAWNALLSQGEYEDLIRENKEYEKVIKENSVLEGDYVIVAYTKLGLYKDQNNLMKKFEAHEVYDGRVSLDMFKDIHLKRWRKFGEETKKTQDKIILFECAFLQNHINELLAVHEKDDHYIIQYLKELIETVMDLNPKLIYLKQNSVSNTLGRVAKERVSENKEEYPDWIDLIKEYLKSSNYGKSKNINDFNDIVKYFEKRQEMELKAIENLSIDSFIVNNSDYNWDNIIKIIIEDLLV